MATLKKRLVADLLAAGAVEAGVGAGTAAGGGGAIDGGATGAIDGTIDGGAGGASATGVGASNSKANSTSNNFNNNNSNTNIAGAQRPPSAWSASKMTQRLGLGLRLLGCIPYQFTLSFVTTLYLYLYAT